MIDRAVTDFPEPDSPTIPTVSPGWTSKETSSMARMTSLSVWNSVRRFSTVSTGAASVRWR